MRCPDFRGCVQVILDGQKDVLFIEVSSLRGGGVLRIFYCTFYHSIVILLPFYCHSTAILLPFYCYSTAILLPFYCHSIAILLPFYCLLFYCHSIAILLLFYCHSIACHSIAILLTAHTNRSEGVIRGSALLQHIW